MQNDTIPLSYPEVINVTNPRARKDHKCCECGGLIKKGEVYENVWGVWDFDQSTFKTCLECSLIRDSIYRQDEGIPFGELLEWVSESNDKNDQILFIVNADKRGGKVPDWFREKALS